MTDCRNDAMRDRLPLLAAGRLDIASRAAVDAHLAECADCRAELALLQRIRATTSRAPHVDTERIAAAVRGAARVRRVPPPAARAASWRRWRVAAAAAAAVVLALLAYDGREPSTPGAAPSGSEVARSVAIDDSIVVAASELSFGGGLADLTTDELSQLVAALYDFDALPSADPYPIAPEISLEPGDTL